MNLQRGSSDAGGAPLVPGIRSGCPPPPTQPPPPHPHPTTPHTHTPRRVQDYYILGAAWGHGATCVVQECVGRYSGRRLALKSRLQRSRGATQAMHNELRILQLCAKHP